MKLDELDMRIDLQENLHPDCPPPMRVRMVVQEKGRKSLHFFSSKADAEAFTFEYLVGAAANADNCLVWPKA